MRLLRVFNLCEFELLPFVSAIDRNPLKTFSMVSGSSAWLDLKNDLIVLCPDFDYDAIVPKSVFLSFYRICFSFIPQLFITDFIRIYLPIPSYDFS